MGRRAWKKKNKSKFDEDADCDAGGRPERDEDAPGSRGRKRDRDDDDHPGRGRKRDGDDDDHPGRGRKRDRDDDDSDRGRGRDRDDKKEKKRGCDDDDTPPVTPEEPAPESPDAGCGSLCEVDGFLFVGSDEDEMIAGKCGNDELYGDRGEDILYGGAGRDYLSGNWGNDVMIGGAGGDTFSFDGDFDRDVVLDFSRAEGDRLDFIFYGPEENGWTPEAIVALFQQDGADAVLTLPRGDETVVLKDVDVADLSAEIVSITVIGGDADLVA